MATLINTNPLGAVDLYLPVTGHVFVEAGEAFDCTDDEAAELLLQEGNYAEPAAPSAPASAPTKTPDSVAPATTTDPATPTA